VKFKLQEGRDTMEKAKLKYGFAPAYKNSKRKGVRGKTKKVSEKVSECLDTEKEVDEIEVDDQDSEHETDEDCY
jgi:hypothetical protein